MKSFSVKAVVIAALAIACTLALAACGGQSSNSPSSSSNTQSKPKIVIGYDKDNFGTGAGQGYTDTGAYNIFIKSALENLGWEAEFKGIDFADVEKSINDGTIDCFWDSFTIQGREDTYAWSGAFLPAKPVIVYKESSGDFGQVMRGTDITTLSALPSGKIIGVQAGTVTYADMPADQKAIVDSMGTLKEYPGLAQCKEALDKGEVDMVLTEVSVSSPLLEGAEYGALLFDPSATASYGVAFKKGNEDKAKAITEALRDVYTSGAFKNNLYSFNQKLGLDSAAMEKSLNDLDQLWLLKDKVIVGYASDNYGAGKDQGFVNSIPYSNFISDALANLGWDVEFKGIPYADIEKSINDGTIDCFWDNYTIQGREDMYAWSEPYRKATPTIVTKTDNQTFGNGYINTDIASVPALPSGKTIGVKAGSVTYADLPADQKAIVDSIGTLKEYPGLTQCKDALDKGEVDMVLTEAAVASPLFDEYPTYGRIVFAPSEYNTYGVAFKKGNEDKAKALSDALRNVYTSGTLKNNFFNYLQQYGIDNASIEAQWNDMFGQTWLLK